MNEYLSLKVSALEHADLATQLTTLSTQGWTVVNIVSTGSDLIAYLARNSASPMTSQTTIPASTPTNITVEGTAGWAMNAVVAESAGSSTTSIPADWYRDPSGRFEHRYWDGVKWTDNVSRAGVMYKDPPIP